MSDERWQAAPVSDPPEVAPRRYFELYRCGACRGTIGEHRSGTCTDWYGLSPSFAWCLVAALEVLGDNWLLIPEHVGAPRIARNQLSDDRFLQRMQSSAHHLADEIAAGRAHSRMPRCLADEVNLAMALPDALTIAVGDGALTVPDELVGATILGAQSDYHDAGESLRQDTDAELLFDLAFDGIEDETEILAHLGVGRDDLRPEHWFEPYLHVTEPIFPDETP